MALINKLLEVLPGKIFVLNGWPCLYKIYRFPKLYNKNKIYIYNKIPGNVQLATCLSQEGRQSVPIAHAYTDDVNVLDPMLNHVVFANMAWIRNNNILFQNIVNLVTVFSPNPLGTQHYG